MKLLHLLPCLALVTSLFANEPPPGCKAIFNGKDLTGWSGEPDRWSVGDGSEARLPIASAHGRYYFAALSTGTAQPEKPEPGSVPLDGKAPDAIPTVQAGPAEGERSNVALNAKASASSEESDKGNTADKAIDGKGSRWCPAKDGSVQMGFVTLEAADKVVLRNIASQEITADIAERDKSETISLMPPGLVSTLSVQDFASLLDYLETLAKEQEKK